MSPLVWSFDGDMEKARSWTGQALNLLYQLKHMKQTGKLNQISSPVYTMNDGTTIRITSIYDNDKIWIESPSQAQLAGGGGIEIVPFLSGYHRKDFNPDGTLRDGAKVKYVLFDKGLIPTKVVNNVKVIPYLENFATHDSSSATVSYDNTVTTDTGEFWSYGLLGEIPHELYVETGTAGLTITDTQNLYNKGVKVVTLTSVRVVEQTYSNTWVGPPTHPAFKDSYSSVAHLPENGAITEFFTDKADICYMEKHRVNTNDSINGSSYSPQFDMMGFLYYLKRDDPNVTTVIDSTDYVIISGDHHENVTGGVNKGIVTKMSAASWKKDFSTYTSDIDKKKYGHSKKTTDTILLAYVIYDYTNIPVTIDMMTLAYFENGRYVSHALAEKDHYTQERLTDNYAMGWLRDIRVALIGLGELPYLGVQFGLCIPL
jgi:hypothetical protein